MEKNWSEVTFDFFENLFGLAGEIGLTILDRAYRYIKFVLTRAGIGLAISALIGALGAYFDRSGVVFVGIAGVGVSITFAFLALSPAVYLLWTLKEKDPKIERIARTAFVLMAGMLVLGVYVAIFHAWQSPGFWILLVAAGILIMATVMTGSSISPEAIGGWAKRVSIIVIASMAVSFGIKQLPDYFRAKFTDTAKLTIGLDSDEVAYESIDKFFSSDGKPVIWYTENDGNRKFYKAPGYDKRTGDSRLIVTKQIVAEEDARRVLEKKVAEQKVANDAKAVADAEAAKLQAEKKAISDAEAERLRAEEQLKTEAQQRADELAKQLAETQAVAPPEVASRSESYSYTIVRASTQSPIATDRSRVGDRISANLTDSFQYQGNTFPQGSQAVLSVVGTYPASGNNPPRIILQPLSLDTSGRKQLLETMSERIEMTPQGQSGIGKAAVKVGVSAGLGALVGGLFGGKDGAVKGALVGAGAGVAIAIITRGPHMEVPAGFPIDIKVISRIKPVP